MLEHPTVIVHVKTGVKLLWTRLRIWRMIITWILKILESFLTVLMIHRFSILLIAQKKYKEALPVVDKAVAAEPSNAEVLMLRGWLNKYQLKNAKAAEADFTKVLAADADDLSSLKGFALHELGRDTEATAWGEKMIKDYPAIGGEAYYYAAALQAAMGNKAQGLKYLESCLANGYGALYDIKLNEDPYVNIAPLRSEPSFNMLLNQSQYNFQER